MKAKTQLAVSSWLKTQFGRPAGFWGSVAGAIMAYRSSNRERARWTVERLELEPGDRVLEVGFGPGVAIETIVRSSSAAVVVGIDHSSVMLRQAASRNAAAVDEGRVQLHLDSVEQLPDFEEKFHKVFAINSVGFWCEPVVSLKRLRGLLVPGGSLVLTVQPRGASADEAAVERAKNRLIELVSRAGFEDVHFEIRAMSGVSAVAVQGRTATVSRPTRPSVGGTRLETV